MEKHSFTSFSSSMVSYAQTTHECNDGVTRQLKQAGLNPILLLVEFIKELVRHVHHDPGIYILAYNNQTNQEILSAAKHKPVKASMSQNLIKQVSTTFETSRRASSQANGLKENSRNRKSIEMNDDPSRTTLLQRGTCSSIPRRGTISNTSGCLR